MNIKAFAEIIGKKEALYKQTALSKQALCTALSKQALSTALYTTALR